MKDTAEPTALSQFNVDPGSQGYDDARSVTFFRDLLERLRAAPGVRSASLVWLPLFGSGRSDVTIAQESGDLEKSGLDAFANMVSDGYFATTGVGLVAGRDFTAAEQFRPNEGNGQVIVSQSLTRRMFGAQNPIGQRIKLKWREGRTFEVIGVSGDALIAGDLTQPTPLVLYEPLGQEYSPRNLTIHVRAAGSGMNTLELARQLVARADPTTFGLATLVLLMVAVAASVIPARRATRIDPMNALTHN
ncbi:MAG: ABC transporter permease [Longimicrobiales bacterium]